MIDLQERFDQAWTGEPAHVDVQQRLAVGHRTLRRRRLAVAAGALGVVVALGGTALAAGLAFHPDGTQVTGGADRRVTKCCPPPTPVDPGVPSGAKGVEVARTVADLHRLGDNNAAYTADGRLVVRPGWLVTQKIDEVYVGSDARAAVGLEVRRRATSEGEWYYLVWQDDGYTEVNRSWPQANLGMTLREWLPDTEGNRSRP